MALDGGVKKIEQGCRIGHLTVANDSGERKNGYIVWNCVCDCGNTIRVDKRTLQRGTITDCGCITKIRPGQRDATGQRFGLLTAQYCTGKKDKNGAYYWHCMARPPDRRSHLVQITAGPAALPRWIRTRMELKMCIP